MIASLPLSVLPLSPSLRLSLSLPSLLSAVPCDGLTSVSSTPLTSRGPSTRENWLGSMVTSPPPPLPPSPPHRVRVVTCVITGLKLSALVTRLVSCVGILKTTHVHADVYSCTCSEVDSNRIFLANRPHHNPTKKV